MYGERERESKREGGREREQSRVDSDPAIFKGHTSQAIISSSFILGDLCLLTHTFAHTRAHMQAHFV